VREGLERIRRSVVRGKGAKTNFDSLGDEERGEGERELKIWFNVLCANYRQSRMTIDNNFSSIFVWPRVGTAGLGPRTTGMGFSNATPSLPSDKPGLNPSSTKKHAFDESTHITIDTTKTM
jgi:hypothetical protein